MSKRRNLVLLAAGLIGVVVIVGLAVAQTPAGEAAQARGRAQIDLVIEVPDPDINTPLKELTELVVSNIGSSGQDGVRFTVDSFFDVFYVRNIGSSGEDGFKANFDVFFKVEVRRTIPTEMVAMSLTGTYSGEFNPVTLIDRVRSPSPGGSTGPRVFYGHVTILK